MSFQSSAQSIGFKNRPVSESSGRTRARAQNIATAGSRKVSSLREQASSRQQEEQRQSGLASQREAYELDKLRDFSSTLQGLWNDVQETVVKEHVKEKRAEGVLLGQAYQAGDEEAKAKLDLNKQQNAQIQKQVNEQIKRSGALADSVEISKYKASLEEKARATNIRKLGNNVAYGFNIATLQAKAQDFPNWFETHVNDSDQTYTVDGVEYTANQFDTIKDGEIRGKLLDQIAFGYVEENSNGIRDSLVVEHLSVSVGAETAKMKVRIGEEAKEENAVNELNGIIIELKGITNGNDLDLAAVDLNSTEGLALQEKLRTAYERMQSINSRLPQNQRHNTAGELFYSIVADITSELNEDPTVGDADISDMMTVLKTMKFNKGNQGLKTLGEHHPLIDWDKLEADAITKKHEITHARQKAQKSSYIAQMSTAQTDYYKDINENGLTATEAKRKYDDKIRTITSNADYESVMLSTTAGGNGSNFSDWEPKFLPNNVAIAAADDLIRNQGHITPDQTKGWSKEVYDKYKHKIVEENFADINVKGSAGDKVLQESTVSITNELKLTALGIKGQQQIVGSEFDIALKWIMKQQVAKAKELQVQAEKDKDQEPLSDIDALREAGNYWVNRIRADNSLAGSNPKFSSDNATDGKHFRFSGIPGSFDAGSGFTRKARSYAQTKEEITEQRQEVYNTINNETAGVFDRVIPGINVEDLEYNKKAYSNGFNPIFNFVEQYDPHDRTPYQLLNAQREANGLKPYNWEEVDPDAHEAILRWEEQNPEIKQLYKSGSELSIDRGLAKQDVMSVNAMTTVLQQEPFPETRFSKDLLREVGVDENLTLEQINDPANADIKTRLIKHEVNRLGQLADVTTNNSQTMVRMVYTGFLNTDDDMKTWNQGPGEGKTDFDSSSRQALNRYLSGSTSEEDTFVSAFQKGEAKGSFQGLIKQETPPNTPEGGTELSTRLAELRKQKPKPRIITTRGASQHRGTSKTNPEYVIWEQKVLELESIERVRKVSAAGGNFDKLDIRRLLGPDVWKQLETQAINEYESKNTGKRKRGEVRPWRPGFNKLVIQKLKEKEVI